jgi:hypothetical protein
MPLLIISIALQVVLVVHIVQTGRNTRWIWIIVMLPIAGSIAYLMIEVLPGLSNSQAGRSARKTVSGTVNPNKGLNQAAIELEAADTVQNSVRLAEELTGKKMYADAKAMYERCLKGMHATDPYILCGLAKTEFGLGNFEATRKVLDTLIEHNPEFKNAEAHLLYARALEGSGDGKAALHEYEALHEYFPGPEASFHYASLSQELGNQELAQTLFSAIVKRAKASGKHYNATHKEWVQKAKSRARG